MDPKKVDAINIYCTWGFAVKTFIGKILGE